MGDGGKYPLKTALNLPQRSPDRTHWPPVKRERWAAGLPRGWTLGPPLAVPRDGGGSGATGLGKETARATGHRRGGTCLRELGWDFRCPPSWPALPPWLCLQCPPAPGPGSYSDRPRDCSQDGTQGSRESRGRPGTMESLGAWLVRSGLPSRAAGLHPPAASRALSVSCLLAGLLPPPASSELWLTHD